MAHDMFVKFSNGVAGESEDAKHLGTDGWCEILDMGFTIQQEEALDGEIETTQPKFDDFTISKYLDTASASLAKGCLEATVYDSVKIELLRARYAGGGSEPIVYLAIELKKVIIKEIETDYDEGALPKESLTLEFGEFSYSYKPVDKKTGAPKAVIPVSYSRFTKVVTGG